MTFTGPERLIAKPGVPAHQAGGTFVGFLLGMLFGLAVALGVAVYITKVPLPFMNKNQTRPADDAAAAKKIKEWDPNAGLPGRVTKPEGAAVQEAPESAPASPAASSAPPLPSTTPAPQASAPAAPAQAKAADPLGDFARARTEPTSPIAPTNPLAIPAPPAAAPPAASGGDPFQYFVQAGAYRSADEAEQQRAKLSLMGLQPKLSERDQAGRLVYRVRLGPFDKREEADKARERLADNGIEAVVVRLQR